MILECQEIENYTLVKIEDKVCIITKDKECHFIADFERITFLEWSRRENYSDEKLMKFILDEYFKDDDIEVQKLFNYFRRTAIEFFYDTTFLYITSNIKDILQNDGDGEPDRYADDDYLFYKDLIEKTFYVEVI